MGNTCCSTSLDTRTDLDTSKKLKLAAFLKRSEFIDPTAGYMGHLRRPSSTMDTSPDRTTLRSTVDGSARGEDLRVHNMEQLCQRC